MDNPYTPAPTQMPTNVAERASASGSEPASDHPPASPREPVPDWVGSMDLPGMDGDGLPD